MATRSRRSASGADNLNPAMIYLLDAVRLRKELQLRGLDTTGNKSILADRLQDAVSQERSLHCFSIGKVFDSVQERCLKRFTEIADVSPSPPKKKMKTCEEAIIVEESFSMEFSKGDAMSDSPCFSSFEENLDEQNKLTNLPSESVIKNVKDTARIRMNNGNKTSGNNKVSRRISMSSKERKKATKLQKLVFKSDAKRMKNGTELKQNCKPENHSINKVGSIEREDISSQKLNFPESRISERNCGVLTVDGQVIRKNDEEQANSVQVDEKEKESVKPKQIINEKIGEKKESTIRKKVPPRLQAPIDVLDSIFDKQAELLSSKFKSEQQKAAERQKLEMIKRRQSAAPLSQIFPSSSIEKRRQTTDCSFSACSDDHSPAFSQSLNIENTLDGRHLLAKLPAPPPFPILPQLEETVEPTLTRDDFNENAEKFNEDAIEGIIQDFVENDVKADLLIVNSASSSPDFEISAVDTLSPSTSANCEMNSEKVKELTCTMQAVLARLKDIESRNTKNSSADSVKEIELTEDEDKALKDEEEIAVVEETKRDTMLQNELIENVALPINSPIHCLNAGTSNSTKIANANNRTVYGDEQQFSIEETSYVPASPPPELLINTLLIELVETVCSEDYIQSSAVDDNITSRMESEVLEINTQNYGKLQESSSNLNENGVEKSESSENKPEMKQKLIHDPRWLLQKASDVLKKLQSEEAAAEVRAQPYIQMAPDSEYAVENEDKPLPEFHGEPVPDDDDEIIVEGVAKKRSVLAKKGLLMQEEEPAPGDEHVEIDFYNADLHIKASESNPFLIDPDNGDGFALMWGGARSTYGVIVPADLDGFPRIAYQCKITEYLPVKHLPFDEMNAHDVRIGWSLNNTTNMLGEAANSYAFSSMARRAVNTIFSEFGETFRINDIITTVLDLQASEISYWKNDRFLGVAFNDVKFSTGDVIFPHFCTKNCKMAVNFGNNALDDWLDLNRLENINAFFLDTIERGMLLRGPTPPPSKSECTVLMMVGLPGVGKTTWVRQYLREHPLEQWTLLSTDTILAAMKVNGIARSRVHQGRWDMVMGLIAKALNRSLTLACRRKRNYIVDQTNVSKEARKRKLTQFKDFQRKCVIMIPTEEEMINRQMRQSRIDGVGPVPVEAMLELKAMFSIPNVDVEPIEEVHFVEPPLERIGEAIELVNRFNEEARPWCQKKRGHRNMNDTNRFGEMVRASNTNGETPMNDQHAGLPRSKDEYGGNSSLASATCTAASWSERKNIHT